MKRKANFQNVPLQENHFHDARKRSRVSLEGAKKRDILHDPNLKNRSQFANHMFEMDTDLNSIAKNTNEISNNGTTNSLSASAINIMSTSTSTMQNYTPIEGHTKELSSMDYKSGKWTRKEVNSNHPPLSPLHFIPRSSLNIEFPIYRFHLKQIADENHLKIMQKVLSGEYYASDMVDDNQSSTLPTLLNSGDPLGEGDTSRHDNTMNSTLNSTTSGSSMCMSNGFVENISNEFISSTSRDSSKSKNRLEDGKFYNTSNSTSMQIATIGEIPTAPNNSPQQQNFDISNATENISNYKNESSVGEIQLQSSSLPLPSLKPNVLTEYIDIQNCEINTTEGSNYWNLDNGNLNTFDENFENHSTSQNIHEYNDYETEDLNGFDEEEYIDYEDDVDVNVETIDAYSELDEEHEIEEIIANKDENVEFHLQGIDLEETLSDGNIDVIIDYVKQVKGITELYPWQKELLQLPEIRNRGNIVYSVPTSGGKSLPAEVMMLHTVRHRHRSALLILPYVSLVNEKYEDFMDYDYEDLDVDLYYANRGIFPPLEGPRLILSTIEKAVPLINSFIESERLNELGLVVIDEFHLVGESRGVHLESIISKFVYLKKKGLHHLSPQIIGMSATFPNLSVIASWILGTAYESEFRPVPLKEHVVELTGKQATVYEVDTAGEKKKVRNLNSSEVLLELLIETLELGISALVFCPSRLGTETLCQQMTKLINQKLSNRLPPQPENEEQIVEVLGKRFPKESFTLGLCYHHAGLKKEDREAVESCFKDKSIKILFCTSTLAAGVNLPAARVIVCSSKIGREILKKSQYKQMCGRAGRAGYDTIGESFLILKSNELYSGWNLVKQKIPNLSSSFNTDAIRKLVMESCTTIMEVPSDVSLLASSTLFSFLSQTLDGVDSLSLFYSAIQDLKNNHLIVDNDSPELLESQLCDTQATDVTIEYTTTTLQQCPMAKKSLFALQKKGKAIAMSSFGMNEASRVLEELEYLQSNGIILSDSLHILYYMTPREPIFYMTFAMWKRFFSMLDTETTGPRKELMRLIGIDEVYIFTASMDHMESGRDKEKQNRHIRYYSACVLQDLIQEKEVVHTYCLENQSSKLDQLREKASYFGAMSLRLCEIMEWHSLAAILKVFVPRVAEGCREELLSLLDVEGIGRKRARMLHRIGITSPEQLAQAKKAYIKSKLGKKLAPRYMNLDSFIDKLIGNAKKYLLRKARELRRQMEKIELSAEVGGPSSEFEY